MLAGRPSVLDRFNLIKGPDFLAFHPQQRAVMRPGLRGWSVPACHVFVVFVDWSAVRDQFAFRA